MTTTKGEEMLSEIAIAANHLCAQIEAGNGHSRIADLLRIEAEHKRMVDAINWACGCGDSTFERPENSPGEFWWRTPLTQRAGLVWDYETKAYVTAKSAIAATTKERV